MEQVDKDINARSKDEPQTYVINPQEPTNDNKCFECDDFFTCDGQCDEVEDEPQTYFSHPCYCCANNNICEFAFTDAVKICRYVYKPQAERSK